MPQAPGAAMRRGPPPVLTRRGADILVRVEKLLDEAAKTPWPTHDRRPNDRVKPARPAAVAFRKFCLGNARTAAAHVRARKN